MKYTIYPYILYNDDFKIYNTNKKEILNNDNFRYWVFDDKRVGLEKEGLVLGTNLLIEKILDDNDVKYTDTFLLEFSNEELNDYDVKLKLLETNKFDGSWYYSEKYQMKNWLCPALFLYFNDAPEFLYAKIKKIK